MNKLSLLLMLGTALTPWSTNATDCVVAPDCASLGYTMSASDCKDKIAVKCPSDSSKVFCKAEAVVSLGLPILYGDGTVSKEILSGKTPIGVVFDETNKFAVALTDVKQDGSAGTETMYWSSGACDTPGLQNCGTSEISNGNDLISISCGADGRANTDAILASTCNGTTYAATAVNSYQPGGCTKDFCKKTKWFLPSLSDLQNIYRVKDQLDKTLGSLGTVSATNIGNKYYKSSTEMSASIVWVFDMGYAYRRRDFGKQTPHNVRPVIYYGESKGMTCEQKLSDLSSNASFRKVTTAAELKAANAAGNTVLMMNDINLGSENLTINAKYVSWPGEYEECSSYARPTLTTTGNVTFLASTDHSLGVNLKANTLTVPKGVIELYGVNVNKFQDDNGQNVWFFGDTTIGTWAANVQGGAQLFSTDGTYIGVIKGSPGFINRDKNRIITVAINGFQNMTGATTVYGGGWTSLDSANITVPASLFNMINGPVELEYNAKVTVSGTINSCNAVVGFYSLDDTDNKSCFNDICPMQKQNCSQFTHSELTCSNGKYSCQ